jgi:hypothetical protein
MLELPIGDGVNEFICRTNGGAACIGHGKTTTSNGTSQQHHGEQGKSSTNQKSNKEVIQSAAEIMRQPAHQSSSSKSSPNRRLYSSGILPPPPSQRQLPNTGAHITRLACMAWGKEVNNRHTINVFRRLTNSDNIFQQGRALNNQEGDFSVDESYYAANGQARYVY